MSWPWARSEPSAPPGLPELTPDERAVEFAWKVHSAQEAWTGRVDGKAALFLATQTAVLAVLFAGFASGQTLDSLRGFNRLGAIFGASLSVLAVLFAGCAVIPMLNKRKVLASDHRDHLIYFGHLRRWDATELCDRLRNLTPADELNQLSLQLVALGTRNWAKHRFLQAAMITGAAGALIVLGAYLQARVWPEVPVAPSA